MIIKSFSTEQFAGINDKQILFSDGMNVVLGDNEAGKSTMISAMYYAFNKPVKIDSRSDREFLQTVFPTGGADTVDATVTVRTSEDEYKLKKIWDKKGRETTVNFKPQSSGLLRGAQAEEALKELLKYGTAVYNNLIFGRQSNEEEVLEWCYSFFSSKPGKDVEEVKKKITEAFSAVGGISPDKFAEMLDMEINGGGVGKNKVKGLIGRWDIEHDEPERDARGNVKIWQSGKGSIVEAFYAYDEARKQLEAAAGVEDKVADSTKRIAELLADKSKHENDREALISLHGTIEAREHVEELLRKAKNERDAAARAIENWPSEEETLEKLKALQTSQQEKANRAQKKKLLDLIDEIQKIQRASEGIHAEINQYQDLANDYRKALDAEKRITTINGMLTSAKLRAAIAMKSGYKTIVTLANGTRKEVAASEIIDVDGFVTLDIPEIATIQVAPQDLDVDGLLEEKTEKIQERDEMIGKYSVASVVELSDLVRLMEEKRDKIKAYEKEIKMLLGTKTLETYQAEADSIVTDGSVEISDDLDDEITDILSKMGKNSLDVAIGSLGTKIEGYEKAYSTQPELIDKYQEYEEQVGSYTLRLEKYSDGPQMTEREYTERLDKLKKQIDVIDKEVGELRTKLGMLSVDEITDISGLEASVEEKKQKWLHEKKKYEYYIRIKADFEALHSKTGDEFNGFYDKFNEYLALITGNRVSLTTDSEGLCLQSESNGVNSKELLSEGTKKTVLLAFRLAVLEYFFPDGGGFVILDDSLLDMDPGRREQAAILLNNFAENNQVIFTTCDPVIADLLGGNLIRL